MAEEKSITERKGGLPFEDRCVLATDCLRRLWTLIQEYAEIDLHVMQENQERSGTLKEGEPEAVREVFVRIGKELRQSYAGLATKLRDTLWTSGIEFARDSYGADAVKFALATLERERPAN